MIAHLLDAEERGIGDDDAPFCGGGDIDFIGAVAQARNHAAALEGVDDGQGQGRGYDQNCITGGHVRDDFFGRGGLDLQWLQVVAPVTGLFGCTDGIHSGIEAHNAEVFQVGPLAQNSTSGFSSGLPPLVRGRPGPGATVRARQPSGGNRGRAGRRSRCLCARRPVL